MYLDGYGEEQRKYVGDIRDVQSISVKDFGGVSAERLQQISKGRFNGAVTVFPDEKREVPMPPNAPNFRRKVSLFSLTPVISAGVLARMLSMDSLKAPSPRVYGQQFVCMLLSGRETRTQDLVLSDPEAWSDAGWRDARSARAGRRGSYSWRGGSVCCPLE